MNVRSIFGWNNPSKIFLKKGVLKYAQRIQEIYIALEWTKTKKSAQKLVILNEREMWQKCGSVYTTEA